MLSQLAPNAPAGHATAWEGYEGVVESSAMYQRGGESWKVAEWKIDASRSGYSSLEPPRRRPSHSLDVLLHRCASTLRLSRKESLSPRFRLSLLLSDPFNTRYNHASARQRNVLYTDYILRTLAQDFKSAATGVSAKAMRNELNSMIQKIDDPEYKKVRLSA